MDCLIIKMFFYVRTQTKTEQTESMIRSVQKYLPNRFTFYIVSFALKRFLSFLPQYSRIVLM